MRTIIVIFTDHKVPVHEIPNFKKYKFLCNYDFVGNIHSYSSMYRTILF